MSRKNQITVPSTINSAGPRYRFWGSQKPPAHRAPIKAEVTANDDGQGTATIRIYEPIDSWGGIWGVSAAEFADMLDEMDPSVTRIVLHLNCPGGEVYEGIAILNLLRQHPADVTAVVDSLAASAASFIAVGVDETVMAPNSQLMIHDAWGICVGAATDMQQMAAVLDKISNNIASVYKDKAGGTVESWRSAMLAETWYDAQEAVDAGLADEVDAAEDAEPATEPDPAEIVDNKFDLTGFKHRGRADAPAPPAASCSCGSNSTPLPVDGGYQHRDECQAAHAARNEHAARARLLTLRERRSA